MINTFVVLKHILQELFKDDDRMDQDTLFGLQDYVVEKLLKSASTERQKKDLTTTFPYLFKEK